MRSIKFTLSKGAKSGWDAAVLLTEAYLAGQSKADQLLEQLPDDFSGDKRSTCQSLFLGALRNGHRTRHVLQPMLRKWPRPIVEAVFLVAGFELYDSPADKAPQIIHHAVERSKSLVKQSEQGLLNAVLRKLPAALNEISTGKHLAARLSHPDWQVRHWIDEFGPEACQKLLEWNQGIPQTYLKCFGEVPEGFTKTTWSNFYKMPAERKWLDEIRPLLESGKAYIKDPSTRLAPDLLAPGSGNTVLDLCAAPGGKAFDLAHRMEGHGHIVAIDLPGARIDRLEENLSKLRSDELRCDIIECDLLELSKDTFAEHGLPAQYDAVMLDAPCSNTGVIQRRADVKWRLRSRDIEACTKLQLQLLHSASRFVKPGGRLVYSTCSIETAENRAIVDAFLASKSGSVFKLESEAISLPWETGHDGAGAFLIVRG